MTHAPNDSSSSNDGALPPEALELLAAWEADEAFDRSGPGMLTEEYVQEAAIHNRQRDERKPFEPYWDEAIGLVKARRFRTQQELADYFHKKPAWATNLKRVVVRQQVMGPDEWRACFSRRGRKAQ